MPDLIEETRHKVPLEECTMEVTCPLSGMCFLERLCLAIECVLGFDLLLTVSVSGNVDVIVQRRRRPA